MLVEIKVLEREGGDTSGLWAEFRALRAKAKRESRRAKAAYWKSRNQNLKDLASDPTRTKQFWNVLLQTAARDCADAIELYRDFLVRRVYDGLMNDSKGRGSSKNGALFLENLALEANWPGPLKKPAAKKFVNEFVASRPVSELADGFKEMSTLRNMSNWVEKERFGLPEYLLRACPASLREGRRLKTKFRLGCHDLRSSSSRTQLVRNAQCPCCASRESETIQHTLFQCEAFEEEREAFLARLYSVCPPARQLADEGRCRLVMGDELPREIENPLYRSLIAISRLRLGILTEQGEGS